ncbi:MAG: hypothetical protein HOK38_04600 [Flavobacteriaceae bacterium]|jgi:perosamine synthetase|nr:hypothetical protein [Flavobacteriaceae bacterium]
MRFLKKIELFFNYLFSSKVYGFITLSKSINLNKSIKLINNESDKTILSFESNFSKILGDGNCVSYSAGRMGLFELLKIININDGDEVIVNSGNCSVMINAIINSNAKPVFSDVDPETYGSCPVEIKNNISPKTKMIIAQHSFGIPCKIDEIRDIAKKNNIFLLEDCALTLESEFNKIKVGNFGDAALFSFDHTKPLNGFSGGLIYTRDIKLYNDLKKNSLKNKSLSTTKQKMMLLRHAYEQIFNTPFNYRFIKILDLIMPFIRLIGIPSPFLNENSGLENKACTYPYPSKMPTFIADHLNDQLKSHWKMLKRLREYNLNALLIEFKKSKIKSAIPNIYYDDEYKIIPLRLVLCDLNNFADLKLLFKDLISIDEVWFQSPIVNRNIPLKDYGFDEIKNQKSMLIGDKILNIPLDFDKKNLQTLIKRIKQL